MNANGGPGTGGTTLSPPPVPPGRVLRAVALTPAVRGYPGGIADMAADQGDLLEGDEFTGGTTWTAGPAGAGQPAAPAPARGTSVWQQSVAVWQEAGIDWLREARREPARQPVPEPRAESQPPAEAEWHTEPIPVVPAFDPPGQAGAPGRTADRAGGAAAVQPETAEAGSVQPEAAENGSAPPAAAHPGSGATGSGAAETLADDAAVADGAAVDEDLIVLSDAAAAGSGAAGAASAAASAANETGAAGTSVTTEGGPAPVAAAAGPGRRRPGRRAVVVAAATSAALVAGAIAGIAVSRSGAPSRSAFGLVTPYPSAALADSDFAVPPGAPSPAPVLTGIAGGGKTLVAVGSQGAAPESLPLILDSQNGGRTWARAALGPGNAAPGPGAVPVLAVRGPVSWLALGQHSAWTSANGRTWRAAPALPMSAGDKILGLARTEFGFIAVGESVPAPPGSGMTSAVLWTSTDGRTWQRKHATTLAFDAGGGSVAALRWAAYGKGVIIVGGEISRPVVEHRGKRRIIVNVESPGLWRSRNGGATWQPVKVPVSHGAAAGLAGLAASGPVFVAIRPGRTLVGHRDAVAYTSTNGAGWRYAGKLTAGRRAPLHVITVAATDQGFVVSGTTGASRVAFVSAQGRGWHKTADQGRSASTIVTSVTVAPGPVVVAAGFRHRPGSRAASPSPYLLLTGIGAKGQRTLVGQAPLAAAGGVADVAVNSLTAAGAAQVAAGSADGAPALWSASASGSWKPVAVSLPSASGSGSLTGVVHGGAGWLAVGTAGPAAQPGSPATGVVVTSADGSAWHVAPGAAALSAPGTALAQAAAGPAGYVAVGSQAGPGGTPAAAAWYSAGLSTWSRATVTGASQPGTAAQMLAVTADRSGFIAAGSVGSEPVVWTSRAGSAWQPAALPLPRGAASAVLTQVAAMGTQVVAAGDYSPAADASRPGAGPAPFAAVSSDGGRHWREAVLRTPGGPATITALTAVDRGFVAAGLSGAAAHEAVISWWSATGLNWQGGQPVRGPAGGGVMQLTTLTAGHGVLTGAGNAVTQSGEHPVLWHARLH